MDEQTQPERPGLPTGEPQEVEDLGLLETLRWTVYGPTGCLVEVKRNRWMPLNKIPDQKRVAQVLISQIRQYLEERGHIKPGQRLK